MGEAPAKDPYDVLKLENQLCFPLYATARATIKLNKPFLDRLDPAEDLPAMTAQEFMDMWNAGIQDPAIMEE